MTRLHQTAMEQILQRIADGDLKPGEWLASEVGLQTEHGVSRGVARETIWALSERGLLEVRHGRGQRVLPEEDWDLLDDKVLVALVTARRIDLLRELVECRALLEPQAITLAVERASERQRAELATSHAAVQDAVRRRRHPLALADPLVQAEVTFHRALARMTGNRPLQRMLEPVHVGLAAARHELAPEEREPVVRVLGRTRKAVEAGDSEAARKSVAAGITQMRRWLARAERAAA